MAAFLAKVSARSFPLTLARAGHRQEYWEVIERPPLSHASLGFPFHHSLFVTSLLNPYGGRYVFSGCGDYNDGILIVVRLKSTTE